MGYLIKNYHLAEFPLEKGWRIFAPKLSVAGIHHHKRSATRFVSGSEQRLSFAAEPQNRHDRNAIKIIGCTKGWLRNRADFIGYVDADIAAAIMDGSLIESVKPRLEKTYMGETGYLEVEFQLIGKREMYDDWIEVRPR